MGTYDEVIRLYRERKLTVREIAEQCGVSAPSVYRYIKAADINSGSVRHIDRRHCLSKYGCSPEQLWKIQNGEHLTAHRSPANTYALQRRRYKKDPGWLLTLPQWWELWGEKFKTRKANNYIFMPIDPKKPIDVNNAHIITRSIAHRTRRPPKSD